MLTAEGCRQRRKRLLERLRPTHALVLADPIHLRYFANFYVEAISQHADFGGLLVIRPDCHTTLFHDAKMPKTVELAHVDERVTEVWYTGQEPGQGPRQMLLRGQVGAHGGRVHDSLADPLAESLWQLTSEMRRRKDPDEVELLKTCMRATDAGHAWGRANIKPGMTELDVYAGVSHAVYTALGHWAVVYGDFAVTSGTKRGGPPSPRVLKKGETFILDYSVVVQGYRSDFTNTLVVGGEPTAEQTRLFGLCVDAMAAGERELKAGAKCQTVYDAIRGVFAAAAVADYFTTHAGHGLGIMHPEAPFIVRHSTETLVAGDVVTLEPGLYVGDNGIRIEHNYLITDTGYQRLSNHVLSSV
jgi:Xaa-Pro aminopeptidase